LTAGEAHDLNGADVLPTNVQADAFLADKVYDAQERVIEKLQENVLDAKLRKYKH
jgi:IS5 family transposase